MTNVKYMGEISFTPASKQKLSLHRFSWRPQVLNSTAYVTYAFSANR